MDLERHHEEHEGHEEEGRRKKEKRKENVIKSKAKQGFSRLLKKWSLFNSLLDAFSILPHSLIFLPPPSCSSCPSWCLTKPKK
jgi:hypothetical protein